MFDLGRALLKCEKPCNTENWAWLPDIQSMHSHLTQEPKV